jgi:hypothetical protein
MLAFRFRKKQSRPAARRESAERRLGYAVDRRPRVKKSAFQFQDVFRDSDHSAELAMTRPQPSGFRQFFSQWATHPRPATTAKQRMDASWPSASGARLSLTVLGIRL